MRPANLRGRNATVVRNYDKVLLAVYITADDAGLVSHATNAEIGAACGLSKVTVPGYLRMLEEHGVIATFRGNGFDRFIVLMDHPDAETIFKRFRRKFGFSDRERYEREVKAMERHHSRPRAKQSQA